MLSTKRLLMSRLEVNGTGAPLVPMEQAMEAQEYRFRLAGWLNAPSYALPLDVCRVVTGVVCASYFVRTLFEVGDYSDVHGLIDHELSGQLFPFTRLTLFANLSHFSWMIIFLLGAICSFGLILGYRAKPSAAIIYVIAVSAYRWNFLVMYIEDAIVHLMLFWMLVLPIGRTLIIKDFIADRAGAWERWKRELVPGAAARCFIMNIALIYLVAGLWKWTSPMWRSGMAVGVIMQIPISYAYQAWKPQFLWLLIPLNYLALAFEPLFPLACVLRSGRLKYCLGIALAAFHVFIIATMKLPFANLLCLGAISIIFRNELMQWVWKSRNLEVHSVGATYGLCASSIVALSVVVLLALAMITSVDLPDWRQPLRTGSRPIGFDASLSTSPETRTQPVEGLGPFQRPFFAALWAIGLAQQYQLLNWIDDRNYLFTYSLFENRGGGKNLSIDSNLMFPMNPRSVILQSYMHGIVWDEIPTELRGRLRNSLKLRYAARYCRAFEPKGEIQVYSTVERITGAEPRHSERTRSLLMAFTCNRGEPVFSS
jgi:hypothetical protein